MRKITVGIDIGTHTTRVVVSEHTKESILPIILGTGLAESKGMRHGYIVNSNEILKSIKRALYEAEKSSGIKIKQVVASIGGISLKSDISIGSAIISKADSEVTALDVDKAVKESEQALSLANRRIIYSNILSCKLDGKEVLGRPEGMKGIKLETRVLYVTALEQHLDDLEAVLLEAGVEVLDILPSPVAAGAIALTERQRTVGVALVNIGAETVSLAVYENNALIGLHVFSIGSTDITNDIALGLKIPLEEAESIKVGTTMNGNYSKRKLDEIIEARLSDIFELIETYLKKIKRSELLPAGIIMTGGGVGLPLIEEMARTVLKLPTKIGSGEMVTVAKGKLRDSSWFVSYGLAVMARRGGSNYDDSSFEGLVKNASQGLKSFFKQFLP
jgi:cell division protein FtsA